jgi:hypothetical protein
MLVAMAVLVAGLAILAVRTTWITALATGVEDGQVVRGDQLDDLEVRIRASGRAAGSVTVMLNGAEVATATDEEGVIRASLDEATSGLNTVSYRVRSKLPMVNDFTGTLSFTVRFGPSLSVPAAVPPPTERRPAVIRGLVADDVVVEVNGKPASREAGAFTAQVKKGARDATVIATAPDGSVTKAVVKFSEEIVKGEPIQAFHVSAPMWRDPEIQADLERLAKEGRINAVELTIKDELGAIGYDTAVPLADQIGAIARDYDLDQALERIHSLGLKAIGRLVVVLDPKLAQWSWNNGYRDRLILDAATGQPYASYYGPIVFTNPGNETVRQYNIEIAVEAAEAGFDHILFDYIRRPEGEVEKFIFPGMDVAPPVAVATLVKETRERLPEETKLGLSVFGIAASRPIMIAQDIRLLAPLVDYIAPMVYPSHWAAGEYKVPNPIAEPGKIVERSVKDFVRIASAGGAYTIPWLQDFDTGDYRYGEAEVRAQIEAAFEAGASGYVLWNPRVRYDYEAFDVMAGWVPPDPAETTPSTTG